MDEEAAFLAAIEATPTEDLPRLVYADWLDERGRPEGEFIRMECELAQLQREWELEQRLRNQLRYESYDVELVPADEFETYLHPRTPGCWAVGGESRSRSGVDRSSLPTA